MSTILQATSNIMSNFTHYIPNININIDECCIKEKQDIHEIQMEPLRLNNINLDELRHAKHKLEMFEETLQHEINEPFFSGHHTWINLLISSIIIGIGIIVLCCCCSKYCCNCRWLPIIGRFMPKKRVVHKLTSNSHNASISNSNVFIHSNTPEEIIRHIRREHNHELLPLGSSSPPMLPCTSATPTEDSQSYRNPFKIKSRRSMSREYSN
ncbi:hypothetical protein ABEB36_010378 [Hypothenemus hampei]|uniref:Uncharacterized protein n=1 Tax=Hypothenemus hampei TaxID=57062 RepID=A0ABD1EMG7_HYPHA